jgi:hypothetical protein
MAFPAFPLKSGALRALIAVMMPLFLLPACTTAPTMKAYFADLEVPYPKLAGFTVCHDTCSHRVPVTVTPATWGRVRAAFSPPTTSAGDERERVVQAVAILETTVGAQVGFSADAPRNDYWNLADLPENKAQLDCVDESTNTTIYLLLLREDGLLTWHDVGVPPARGAWIDGRWPHQAAMLVDKKTGEKFAVDTWFRRNGERAYVVRYDDWFWGYGTPSYSLTPLNPPPLGKTATRP